VSKYCENCGSKSYNGACTNCHEEIYIEQQYIELDMPMAPAIEEKANDHRREIERAKRIKESF